MGPLPHEETESLGTDRPWVIVAEDDWEMLRLLLRVLSNDGYKVVMAGSGLELYDTLRHLRRAASEPSLVVSDIRMPGLNGIEVLQTMRSWGWTTPVVLITAFPDEETLAAADAAGATAVMTKPFEMDDLRTTVRYLMDHPSGLRKASITDGAV